MANSPSVSRQNRNAILAPRLLFCPRFPKRAHHVITADPDDKPEETEKKYTPPPPCSRPQTKSQRARE